MDAGAQFFERAIGDQLTVIDDGDVGAEALDDFQHMRGEKDGCAAGDHALQHLLEGTGGNGVYALEGFVEKQNFGCVDDGCGQGQLLLHAVREVGDELLGFVGEAHEFEQLFAALEGGGAIEAVHLADETEILGGGEAAEEGEALGDDADLALDFKGVCGEVHAEHLNAAGGGCEQAGKHLDGGGLACAVGAEEPEELAGRDAEIDVLHGNEIAEAAGEPGGGDGSIHSFHEHT